MGRRLALASALLVGVVATRAHAQLDQSGIFRAPILSTIGSSPTATAVGDFNRDGSLDVVATNAGPGGNSIVVALGFSPPDGSLSNFPPLSVGSFPADLITGRFDGDDIDDVIVANLNDSAVVFLRGTGTSNPGGDGRRFFAAPGPPIAVGMGPRALAAADIDDDGNLDLAVANEGSDGAVGSVSILLGQGDGTFERVDQDPNDVEMLVNDLPAGIGTRRIEIAEVSGDDVLDVLALNEIAGTVTIFFGNGDGTFAPGLTQAADGAADIAVGDLNGDGDVDLVTAENNADRIGVRLGNGDGTFGGVTHYRSGTAPLRVALEDVDRDGALDAVSANSRSQDVTFFRGVGDGTFEPGRTYIADAEPRALAFADLDDDGRTDVVAVTEGGDGATAAVLLGREDGTLQAPVDLAAGGSPSGFAVGDVDDDAVADLVAVTDSGNLIFFRGGAGGLDDARIIQVSGRPHGVVLAYLNNDKYLDVAFADIDNSRVQVALGDGRGGFGARTNFPTAGEPAAIVAGDFNGDRRVDLAVVTETDDVVSVLLHTATNSATFEAPRNVAVGETPIDLAVLDANCDGRDDLVVANTAARTLSVLVSSASGNMTVSQTIPSELVGDLPSSLGVGDFDSDGMDDVAVSNGRSNGSFSVRTFLGTCGGTLAAGQTLRAGDIVSALVARDLTGDQIADIAVVNQTSNVVRTFLGAGSNGEGNGTFNARPPDGVSRMPELLASGDFDDDGRYDVVAGNTDASANNVTLLFNCARDPKCHIFGFAPPGEAANRGDANDDGILSAADFAAVAAEVIDGDGERVEQVGGGFFAGVAGADANGDGRVDEQDVRATARRLFAGS